MKHTLLSEQTESAPTEGFGRDEILENLGKFWTTSDIRALGQTLLKLADCSEQDWRPEHIVANHGWGREAANLHRGSIELALKAQVLQAQIHARSRHFPFGILNDPPWAMMLELFVQSIGGAKASFSSLCAISGCDEEMTHECLSCLILAGLVEQYENVNDGAQPFYSLSEEGFVRSGRFLRQTN